MIDEVPDSVFESESRAETAARQPTHSTNDAPTAQTAAEMDAPEFLSEMELPTAASDSSGAVYVVHTGAEGGDDDAVLTFEEATREFLSEEDLREAAPPAEIVAHATIPGPWGSSALAWAAMIAGVLVGAGAVRTLIVSAPEAPALVSAGAVAVPVGFVSPVAPEFPVSTVTRSELTTSSPHEVSQALPVDHVRHAVVGSGSASDASPRNETPDAQRDAPTVVAASLSDAGSENRDGDAIAEPLSASRATGATARPEPTAALVTLPSPPAATIPISDALSSVAGGRDSGVGLPAPVEAARSEATTTSSANMAPVRDLLARYRAAYQSLDAHSAKQIWPGVDEQALARAFEGLDSQTVTFDACDVAVTDARAVASCRGSASYVTRMGTRSIHTPGRQWNFRLQKSAEQWLIESVQIR